MGLGYLLDYHLSSRPGFVCGLRSNAEKLSVVRRSHYHVCSDPGRCGVFRRLRIVERRDTFCRNSCYSGCHAVMARRQIAQSSQRELIFMIF